MKLTLKEAYMDELENRAAKTMIRKLGDAMDELADARDFARMAERKDIDDKLRDIINSVSDIQLDLVDL